MAASDAVLQLVCAVLVLAVPAAVLIAVPAGRSGRFVAVAVAGIVGGAASLTVDTLVSSPSDGAARILDAALAAAITAFVAIIAARRLRPFGGAVFASIWSIIVFQPVFAAVVGSVPSLVQTVFGAVDYAGVLATHGAAAASLIPIFVLPFPPPESSAAQRPLTLPRALGATALLTIGASAWMVGAERVINDATGRILLNAVVGLLIGAVIWSVIERIAGRPFTTEGLVAGAVLGWASVGLGVAFLSPMALGASAVIGVAGGAAVVVRARAGADRRLRGAIAIIVSVAIGGTVLALLADGFGMSATGSTALVVGQLGALLVVAVGAFVAGLLCWALGAAAVVAADRTTTRQQPAVDRREG